MRIRVNIAPLHAAARLPQPRLQRLVFSALGIPKCKDLRRQAEPFAGGPRGHSVRDLGRITGVTEPSARLWIAAVTRSRCSLDYFQSENEIAGRA